MPEHESKIHFFLLSIFFTGVGCETDHLPLSTAKVMNAWTPHRPFHLHGVVLPQAQRQLCH
jgi:hypothetical protein